MDPHESLDMTGGVALEALQFGIGAPISQVLEYGAVIIDLIGVSIILFGFGVALVRLILGLGNGAGLRRELGGLVDARFALATYILTGLEFMIASDIIHTVITREFADLAFVGLLVLIRTAISFFLGREAMDLRREGDHHAA